MQKFRTTKTLPSRKDASRKASTSKTLSRDVDVQDLDEEDIIVAVMGATGSGMTTFASHVTGRNEGIGHGLLSCTNDIKAIGVPFLSTRLVVIDTPGFNSTNRTNLDVLKQISGWMQPAYNKGLRLSGLLYFHRISDNRMSGTAMRHLRMFKQLCGEKDVFQKLCLVTTMWEKGCEKMCEEWEDELKRVYWREMLIHGAHIQRFENSPDSARAILNMVLSKEMGKRATCLPKQVKDLPHPLPSSGVGQQRRGHTGKKIDQSWASINPSDLTREKVAEMRATAEASRQMVKSEQSEGNIFKKLFRMLRR